MNNEKKDDMNVVEVNLNNGDNDKLTKNIALDINYHELNNNPRSNKEYDNSGDELNNNQQDDNEEEPEQEQEELSLAEIAHLKKIHEQTLLRSEKYANLYSPQSSEKKLKNSDVGEKLKSPDKRDITLNISNNILEMYNEGDDLDNEKNDTAGGEEEKINPNKERIFKNCHCFFYLNDEPLVVIGPDLGYYIWIYTFVSFFCIIIYSLKTSSYFLNFFFVGGYIIFTTCYFLLMAMNPGVPTEKNHYDINDLNINYKQCKICNCIYHKKDSVNVHHCEKCGICVEGCERHSFIATKCIGKNNISIYKAWVGSAISLVFIVMIYLLF